MNLITCFDYRFVRATSTATTHNTIVVKWNLTSVSGCGDVSSTVTICPNHGSGGMIVNNMATFSGLENGTTYTITVTAANRAGSVESMIRVSTLGERPSTGMIILHYYSVNSCKI